MIYKPSRIFALSFFALLIGIPSLVVILGTFKTTLEVSENPLGIPDSFNLSNYRELL
jgi:raffinose/stachyose/melibiose transport system permease protein